ncbi:unnamed protein product [Moneuplotes crassus]|uniref:Uncharacterized protein n=1 Tax=Euplotes crassus TaxID=5936 RepID=A0AAD1X5V2_EUPCR|nr:unnamed protein product [Moneuplotes crassus]
MGLRNEAFPNPQRNRCYCMRRKRIVFQQELQAKFLPVSSPPHVRICKLEELRIPKILLE